MAYKILQDVYHLTGSSASRAIISQEFTQVELKKQSISQKFTTTVEIDVGPTTKIVKCVRVSVSVCPAGVSPLTTYQDMKLGMVLGPDFSEALCKVT